MAGSRGYAQLCELSGDAYSYPAPVQVLSFSLIASTAGLGCTSEATVHFGAQALLSWACCTMSFRDTEDMGVRMGQGVAEMYHAQVCHAMHTEL